MRSHRKKKSKGITILAITLRENRNAKLINVYEDWEQKWPEGLLKHPVEEKAKKQDKRKNNNLSLCFLLKIDVMEI